VPDLTAQVGWNRYFLDRNDSVSLTLSMPVPVFDQNRGQVLEAEASLRQAERQERAAENEAVRALRDDLEVLRTSRSRIARFEQLILPLEREAVDKIDLSYQGGNVLYLDVIAARAAFNQSRADYVTELSNYETTLADLERVLGEGVEVEAR
jgi:cobalt-zinc-cadmium efflux system outer membrane protein